MRTLPNELFAKYRENPSVFDEEVRDFAGVPDNRFYTVSMWPEHLAGRVEVDSQARTVKAKKISKSHPT